MISFAHFCFACDSSIKTCTFLSYCNSWILSFLIQNIFIQKVFCGTSSWSIFQGKWMQHIFSSFSFCDGSIFWYQHLWRNCGIYQESSFQNPWGTAPTASLQVFYSSCSTHCWWLHWQCSWWLGWSFLSGMPLHLWQCCSCQFHLPQKSSSGPVLCWFQGLPFQRQFHLFH